MSTPAGWYPNGDHWETYWDGERWADEHRPRDASASVSTLPAAETALVGDVDTSSASPFAGQGFIVIPGDEGVTLTATGITGRGILGAKERTLAYEDLVTVELSEPGAMSGGAIKLRTATATITVYLARKQIEGARTVVDEIHTRHREATGRSLNAPAPLSREERATAMGDDFARCIEPKITEIVASIRAADVSTEASLTFEMEAWAKRHRVKNGVDLARARLAAVRTELGLPAPVLIGAVNPDSISLHTARGGKFLNFVPGVAIFVYEDRVAQGAKAYPIDAHTQAQVYVDGQSQITTRPTLTRAALLSPLPGSALLPSLALAKKQTNDSRVAEFQVGGLAWSFTVRCSPDQLSEPRQLAQRINSIASAKEEASRATAASTTGTAPAPDLISQIERIVELERAGAISTSQAEELKAKLINA